MRRRAGLAGNTAILTSGTVIQTVIALATVPLYLSALGEARYGAWILAGIIVAYVGLLDRAMGAAAQREMSRLDDAHLRSSIFWTAVVLNTAVGLLAAAVVIVAGEFLFAHVIDLPTGLAHETEAALPELAASVPILAMSAVFQGALMARGRVATVSALETARLTMLQLVPLAFVYWRGPDLEWLALGVVVALSVSAVSYLVACLRLVLAPYRWVRPARPLIGRLFHFGKWITVTAIVTPLLDFSDRVLIGAMRGTSAVTAYAIPYNLTSRLTIIPYNVVRVSFPQFASLRHEEGRALGKTASAAVAAVTAPAAVIGSILSGPFFEWWLGGEVAGQAAPVAAVLFAGFWVNGLGYVPSTLMQAQGKPEVPAKLHLAELVPFLVLLAAGVYLAGPIGAAVAWSLRALTDTVVLMALSSAGWWRNRVLALTATVVGLAAACGAVFAFQPLPLIALGTPLCAVSIVCAWRLSPPEFRKQMLRARQSGDGSSTPGSAATGEDAPI